MNDTNYGLSALIWTKKKESNKFAKEINFEGYGSMEIFLKTIRII